MQDYRVSKPISHVAIIMDGNGRWATSRGLKRTEGHKEGFKRIVEILEETAHQNIKVLTVFAFSTQNWNRPKDEIDFLFSYIQKEFKEYIATANKYKIKISVFGDYTKLPKSCVDVLEKAIDDTKNYSDFFFNICLNYGSHEEIYTHTYTRSANQNTASFVVFL